jgi:hypothetical protein
VADGLNHPVIYSIDQWIDIMVGSEQNPPDRVAESRGHPVNVLYHMISTRTAIVGGL